MKPFESARLTIRAPEGVEFSLPLAGPASRFLAVVLDIALISVLSVPIGNVLSLLGALSPDFARALSAIAYFLVSLTYAMAAEWYWRGQTVGKRVMKLRVIDAHGGRLEPAQIVMRNLLRPVDMLPAFYLVGAAFALLNPRYQRLGDLAAGTVVVRREELAIPDLDQILGARFNSMLAYRHLAARLRNRVPPTLAAAALDALIRRDQFDPQPRLEVFHQLATRLRTFATFPAEATETLSDEHYVRNAVEILFRRK